MCGIIGYVGEKPVVPVLIDGLRRLEYRGYDSAGVALVRDGEIEVRRSAGKLARLEETIADHPVDGDYGLGHTRWATHGRPTEENAHPHRDCTGRIVVVHNGIIENYLELKRELEQQGHRFETQTDTEVIAHLIEREMRDDGLEHAVRRALSEVHGLFGMVLLAADDPYKLVAVRNGPPIVVGMGDQEYLVASDVPAVLSHTRDVVFLGDEEMAVITPDDPKIHFQLALQYWYVQHLEECAEAYRKVIALEPNHVQAHLNIASVYERLKDWDNALKEIAISRQLGKETGNSQAVAIADNKLKFFKGRMNMTEAEWKRK